MREAGFIVAGVALLLAARWKKTAPPVAALPPRKVREALAKQTGEQLFTDPRLVQAESGLPDWARAAVNPYAWAAGEAFKRF